MSQNSSIESYAEPCLVCWEPVECLPGAAPICLACSEPEMRRLLGMTDAEILRAATIDNRTRVEVTR